MRKQGHINVEVQCFQSHFYVGIADILWYLVNKFTYKHASCYEFVNFVFVQVNLIAILMLVWLWYCRLCGARGREAKGGIGIALQVAPHQRDGTKAPISSGEGAWWYFRVLVAWAAPSVCVIKGKTINMELDSTGPTALKVTDSPLLWLAWAMVWYKQQRPAKCYYCMAAFITGRLIICRYMKFIRPAALMVWCSGLLQLCSLLLGRTSSDDRCGR